jgi:DNA-binding protein H-NS
MAKIDIGPWEDASIADLFILKAKLSRHIDGRLEAQKREYLDQIKQIAVDHNLTYDEVVAAIRTTTRRGKAPPLYRNPKNARQTWSGKGEAPDWFKAHPDPESLRIPEW